MTAHAIEEQTYLSTSQVDALKLSLARVRQANRRLRMAIAYAWDIDLDSYYSDRRPARSLVCELPDSRLDIHADGHMALCVSGQNVGQVGRDSIASVWRGARAGRHRQLYSRTRHMPMCFRCCGLSQTIRFDPSTPSSRPSPETARCRVSG